MSQSRQSLGNTSQSRFTAPTTYAFPVLKVPELLTILNELCPDMLAAADFKQMTCERIKPVYERLTKLLFTTVHTVTDGQQPSFNDLLARDGTENNMIQPYDDTINEIKSLKSILFAMKSCGVYDCTLTDITSPDSVRTKKILSAYINYARFREEKLAVYTQYSEQTETLIEKKYAMEVKNGELKQQLSTLDKQYESDGAVIAQLNADLNECNTQLAQLKSVHDSLKQWLEINRAAYDRDTATHQTSLTKRQQLQNDSVRLNGFIVKEPEKLKQSMVDGTTMVNVLKTELSEQGGVLRDKQNKLNAVKKTDGKLSERIESMNEIVEAMRRYKKLSGLSRDASAEIERIEQQYQQLLVDEQRLKKLLQANTDKLVTLHQQYETKRVKAQLALEQIQSEKVEVGRVIEGEQTKVNGAEAVMKNKQIEYTDMIQQHEDVVKQLQRKYAVLQSTVQQYHQQLFQVMASQPVHQ